MQERERAASLGYEDPINPTFEATTAMYEKVLCEVLEQTKQRPKGEIAVMVASHNEDTVRYTVQKYEHVRSHVIYIVMYDIDDLNVLFVVVTVIKETYMSSHLCWT